jgi:chromosome segregation ATPase
MEKPSMESYLTGRTSEPRQKPDIQPQKPASPGITLSHDSLKTGLMILLFGGVLYLFYDGSQYKQTTSAELVKISDQLKALENRDKVGEANLSNLKGMISATNSAVGSTKAQLNSQLKKTAQQIQEENSRARQELSQAISTKADTAQVQALKQESDTKIGQVSTEVGGVKTEVGAVKGDLATTRSDLQGTQRQLLDVRETLTAAVAKNSSELSELRRKGERDYFEFEIPKKNLITKVEDIRLLLTKTDAKKGKYTVKIVVDDNQLEKKDRTVNEPVQFLVGRNRLRYELVVNWVQKDRIGGYLSTPKDKALSAERTTAAAKE